MRPQSLDEVFGQKTIIGIEKAEILTHFPQILAIIQAHEVVQIFEPREIAIPWASGIRSAVKNEIAIIVTRELLCIAAAQTAQRVIDFQVLSVNLFKIFSNHHQVNSLNHFQRKIIPNIKRAIQPEISQKSLLE